MILTCLNVCQVFSYILDAQVVPMVRILHISICSMKLQFMAPILYTLEIYTQEQYRIMLIQWISLKCIVNLHNFLLPLFPLVLGSNSNNTIPFRFLNQEHFGGSLFLQANTCKPVRNQTVPDLWSVAYNVLYQGKGLIFSCLSYTEAYTKTPSS